MYEKDGEKYFVVDGHTHFWDASRANQLNKYGTGFIDCFYGYHNALSPDEYKWDYDKFLKYDEQTMMHDLFEIGYDDIAILQPTYLKDFFANGFNTIEQDAVIAEKHPDRFIVNGAFDPRLGEAGLDYLAEQKERYDIKGVKLYTAEWKGNSKGWKLSDPWAYKYLEKCLELGIKNIHVHKGPTLWPFNRDAFDVADVDDAASAFTDLTFIVEHCGLPRLEDFCWIAVQESNVLAGLSVVMPFIHTRPRYFAQVMGELLYWVGEDNMLFSSDYAIWQPKWLIEKFIDFQIPADMSDYAPITTEQKKKIMGLNAARLYDIQVPAELQLKEAAPA